jgi:5-amino-6-(5-phospho-D-ribitylamino)uracil phosphatase
MNNNSSKSTQKNKEISEIKLGDYKLIVFDIDGTLVGPTHILDPYTREILLKLNGLGIQFTLATGKNLPATIQIADELKIELPLILSNGSMIETRHGKVFEKSVLPETVTKQVVFICEEENKNLVIYIDDNIIMKKMNKDIFPIYNQVTYGIVEVGKWAVIENHFKEVNKCLVVEQHFPKDLIKLEKRFEQEIGEESDIIFTSTKLLEVLPKGITKVRGIQKLAQSLGIEMREVMAFGDYDNDIGMLSAAGLGVAVQNGSAAAKASANLVIETCAQNGPAKFLEKLMKSV